MGKTNTKMMNLPNQLTIFRVILIVPFVLVLLGSIQGWGLHETMFGGVGAYAEYTALAIFIVASLTDLLDGKIARKYNLVTNFGKFMDPLVVVVIISREFIISGFRLIASDNGVVIAASYWGKFKTTFQMVMICMMLVKDAPFLSSAAHQEYFALATDIVMWIALVLTVVSLVDYLVKNRNVMKDGVK